ncbi:UDP:flavonoid glycosyltransferase YjiC (YdhE family) [Dyadobacter jejuensis]|uniref:UDP:flavonoid glycosyltransferase YjiC (YdhE family) n=1 Tax=Dyadobacter jejuensis TaxID=1082580 RepID=A0A316BAS5_9BACT|nr:glycosyltransferase [Dyadobacter jejuensis]PWJ59647.1 UDP:flavonoid glycosyltransferase YjiC (YdhE family) [Dyadobacter jejuensis]
MDVKSVVFVFPNLAGHLNRTIKLAYEYQQKGYVAYYAGLHIMMPFVRKYNFEFYALSTLPFATGIEELIHEDKEERWLESLLDRFSGKLFHSRHQDLQRMLAELKPSIIFLDHFNYSDFVVLHPLLTSNTRLVFLQTKFPMYEHALVPPPNTFAFPGKDGSKLWIKYYRKHYLKQLWENIKYLGKSNLNQLKRKFKELDIPAKHRINTKKTYNPAFDHVEEWFLVPQELDFPEQSLKSWQKYLAPMVDLSRDEEIDKNLENFVKDSKGQKLIYCSLGTVLSTHLKHGTQKADSFFQNIYHLVGKEDQYRLILVIPKDVKVVLSGSFQNILILEFAPQLYILKHADLFLTHSGNGSVFESISLGVPMLLFPLNNKWDQNGTAARVVYHGLGIKLELAASQKKLSSGICQLLNDNSFKINTQAMSRVFSEKYF